MCAREEGRGEGRVERKGKRDGEQARRGESVEERESKLWIEREREWMVVERVVEVVEKRSLRKKETEKEGGGRTERAKSDVRRGRARRG